MSEDHKIIEGDAIYHVRAVCPHCGEDALVPLGLRLVARPLTVVAEIVTLDAGDR